MKWKLFMVVAMIATAMFSQQDSQQDSLRVVNRLGYNNASKLTIGGYAQIDYNEPDGPTPGNLDVHRLVLLFGYKFSDKVSFLTEIELEHVKEVYVEQAFVNYSFSTAFNLRGGLMLVPMGYVNAGYRFFRIHCGLYDRNSCLPCSQPHQGNSWEITGLDSGHRGRGNLLLPHFHKTSSCAVTQRFILLTL